MKNPEISIVIPCFNEETGICNTYESIKNYFNTNYPNKSWEILFINDGSNDKTLDKLTQIEKKEPNVNIFSFEENRGRGEALKTGFKNARGNLIITLDADLSYDVNHIGDILKTFESKPSTDVVVVSAYMKNGTSKGVPFKRLIISRLANWILSGFLSEKISTVTCVVRGYKAQLIKNLVLLSKNKEIHLEILRKAILFDANLVEIPGRLVWHNKNNKPRRSNNLKFFHSAKTHFLYALSIRPTFYLKIFAFILIAIGLYELINITYTIFHYFVFKETFFKSLWLALNLSYTNSPHTFLITLGSFIIGLQILLFIFILKISRLQHEELLKHILVCTKSNN